MIIGFTGTQEGMSKQQIIKVGGLLVKLGAKEARHGDCIGADSDFHEICKAMNIKTYIHPPTNSSKRAFCVGDFKYEPKPYLERNKDIVRGSQVLIATPKSEEELRSGTWSTIRYARKLEREIYIIFPSGEMMYENY